MTTRSLTTGFRYFRDTSQGEAEMHRDRNSFHYFIGLCAHAVYREYQVQLRTELSDPSLAGRDHFYYIWKNIAFVFIELHTGNTIFYVSMISKIHSLSLRIKTTRTSSWGTPSGKI